MEDQKMKVIFEENNYAHIWPTDMPEEFSPK